MTEERFAVYCDSLEPDLPALFSQLEEEAERDRVPILRRETASLLETLLLLGRPERILEIGTATGYSGLRMLRVLPEARLTTLEKDPERAALARAHFEAGGVAGRTELLLGDAGALLPELEGPYPFIFLDGPKGQYPEYLPELKRLLAPGGLLVTDNVLQEGRLLDSRYSVIRRDRTIHSRMRAFVEALYHDDSFHSTLLPLEDGVLLSYRVKEGT